MEVSLPDSFLWSTSLLLLLALFAYVFYFTASCLKNVHRSFRNEFMNVDFVQFKPPRLYSTLQDGAQCSLKPVKCSCCHCRTCTNNTASPISLRPNMDETGGSSSIAITVNDLFNNSTRDVDVQSVYHPNSNSRLKM